MPFRIKPLLLTLDRNLFTENAAMKFFRGDTLYYHHNRTGMKYISAFQDNINSRWATSMEPPLSAHRTFEIDDRPRKGGHNPFTYTITHTQTMGDTHQTTSMKHLVWGVTVVSPRLSPILQVGTFLNSHQQTSCLCKKNTMDVCEKAYQ